MKKASLFLIAFLIGIVGYLFYNHSKSSITMINDFISDNTLVLIETNEALHDSQASTILAKLPLFERLHEEIKRFDELGLSESLVKELFKNKKMYFAVLPLGKEQLQTVTYLPLTSSDDTFLEELNALKTKVTGFRIISHTTEGQQISEIINPQGKSLLSFIVQDKLLIYSPSSILIEDILLAKKKVWSEELALGNSTSNQESTTTVTYWNKNAIKHFSKLILEREGLVNPAMVDILPTYFFWTATKAGDIIGSNETATQQFFGNQAIQSLNCLSFVPNATASLSHWSISDNSLIKESVENQLSNSPKLSSLKDKAKSEFDIDFEEIYESIKGEIILCNTTLGNTESGGQILLIQQEDLLEKLTTIGKNVAENSKTTVFSMQYGNFVVHRLGFKEFPAMAFGPYFYGFQESFYTQYKDHVVIANNLQTLQDYLQAITKNDVWSSSVKNQALVKRCKPASTTVISDIAKVMPLIEKALNSHWKSTVSSVSDEITTFSSCIYQVENEHRSSLTLLKSGTPSENAQKYSNKLVKLSSVSESVTSAPFYLFNPATKKAEVLVQGSTNKLFLVGDNKSTWTYQLPDKLVGVVKPVKIVQNEAQQFLLATATNVYLLIRTATGFDVKESPRFSGIQLTEYGILDETNESLSILTKTGQLYLLDKASLQLRKSKTQSTLATYLTPLNTLLMNGKSYALLLESNGKLNLVNHEGQSVKGFPIRLKGVYKQAPILEENGGMVYIRTLSEQGELSKITTNGNVVEEKQLFRPNNEDKFSLSLNDKQNDWVILRSDGKNCTILDKNTEELFSLTNLPFGNKQVQYYRLANTVRCFAFSNGWSTYNLYDDKGNPLSDKPLVSTSRPNITYSESYNKILINTTSATSLDTWSIKLK
ncbi:MAG: hypothetical protein ACOVOW_02770 [Spirosomataceae bacterium]